MPRSNRSPAPRLFRRTGLRNNYPRTVEEVLSDEATYPPAVLRAMRAFKRSKPYRGTAGERQAKMRRLITHLARAYRIDRPALVFGGSHGARYLQHAHVIDMGSSLSVVTLLHEFAHARGADEVQACRWSVNLFRRIFPRLFERCRRKGHMLLAPRPAPRRRG